MTATRAQAAGDEPLPERCAPAVPASSAVQIRAARPTDRPTLVDMLSRCTDSTRWRRFLAPMRSFPEPYLTRGPIRGPGAHCAGRRSPILRHWLWPALEHPGDHGDVPTAQIAVVASAGPAVGGAGWADSWP
jgi:hypothetical protein